VKKETLEIPKTQLGNDDERRKEESEESSRGRQV
jgi:hypothetical protein